MSLIKSPQSPQIINHFKVQSKNNNNNKISQSVKIEKSRNSIIEEQDEQATTVIKLKTKLKRLFEIRYQRFIKNIHENIFQKVSPNETKILINNNDQSNSLQIRSHTKDAMISITPKGCCFCEDIQNVFPIYQCSQANQKCADEFLQQQILCKNCNQYRHVNGIMKKNKSSLCLEFLFLLITLAIIGVSTFITFFELYDQIGKDRLLVSCLKFSYSIWIILLICLISRMLTYFQKVQLHIKRFDSKNVQYNKNYVNLMMNYEV